MTDYLEEAQDLFEYTQSMRRDFHTHPELGFHEVRTAGIVAKELTELGLEVTPGVAKTGVVALIEGGRPGPVVLARFDMDALPIVEQTGAAYASQNQGVMHACGHDGHTAIGLTVAKMLNAHRDELAGRLPPALPQVRRGVRRGLAARLRGDGPGRGCARRADPRPTARRARSSGELTRACDARSAGACADVQTPWILISMSTPAGRSSFCSASTAFVVTFVR